MEQPGIAIEALDETGMEQGVIPGSLEITQQEQEPAHPGGSLGGRLRLRLENLEGTTEADVRLALQEISSNPVENCKGLADQRNITSLRIHLEGIAVAGKGEDPDELPQFTTIDFPWCPGNQDRDPRRAASARSQHAEFLGIQHADRQLAATSPRGLLQARLGEFFSQTLNL